MALRAKKPEVKQNRLKLFLYGNAKVGKSTLAIQFPKPYIIDTEGSMDKKKYVELIEKSKGSVFETQDFDDLIQEVKSLLTLKHDYKTLVIDSLTILYNDLLDKAALKVGTEFGRHYNEANKSMKHLFNLLLRLDMNVIITSHAKNEYGQNMSIVGHTFDCYKKLDYLFDLILEMKKLGKERKIFVKGSRIESFKEDESFSSLYEEVASRYDNELLEREASQEELATKEDVAEAKRLIDLLKITEETYIKWLEKAKASTFEEMPREALKKCIVHLNKQIKGEKAA